MARRLGPLVLLLGSSALAACGSSEPVGNKTVDRVLIVSMPGVSWSDVESHELPNLEALVDRSAIGDLSTRIGRRGASTTDAYLSIGAGTRAIAPTIDVAVALDPDETYAGVRTADILERRLGEVPDGVAYLAAGAAIDLNEGSSFGGHPGRLGDLLERDGVFRAVVANADASEGFVSDEPPPDGSYARGAATALMGSDGIVPGGTVGRGLLLDDPLAPFGRRLDQERVLDAFDAVWDVPGPSVVLVEASDLSRASAYGLRSTPSQRAALRTEALTDSDALLGALLEQTDPDHDAVLVVSPVSPSASPELGIAVLRAPGAPAGVLRSSTTRRDGYVQLADVAPTVLDLLGLDEPEEIEGRAFRISRSDHGDRITHLVEGAEAAEFRDGLMVVVVPLVIGGLALLLLATVLSGRLRRPVRMALTPLALVALGVVPGTFLAARIGVVRGNTAAYLLAVAALAGLVGGVATLAERRRPGLGALVGVAAIVALIGVDVLVGAPLQVNAVFGYSVAVAGRFAGLGNLAFALFGAAAVILSALIVDRYGRRSLPVAIGLLAGVVLVEGLPMLGADVGGVLSMVPAFVVTGVLLSGRRLGLRHLGLGIAGGIGGVLLFAFIDVARPEGSRTHLARLAENLLDGRWGPFVDSLTRRLQASFGSAELAAWVAAGLVIIAGATYAVLAARAIVGPDAPRRDLAQPSHAAALGVGWLAVAGLIANDSSIAVPATMLIVAVPVYVLRRLAAPEPPAASS